MKIDFKKPFALIKRQGEAHILFLEGNIKKLDYLKDIPRKNNFIEKDLIYDTISVLPFSQIKEKGFSVIEGDEKILTLEIENQKHLVFNDFLKNTDDLDIELESQVNYTLNEQEYGDLITNVINDEIGNGEGANFVIPRIGKTKIKNCSHKKILSLYKRILRTEVGSYWSFLFFDGSNYIIGASPERNVSIYNNQVRMNPISGTYRKPELTIENIHNIKKHFLSFLRNQKEINELFMVVDEELKMMSKMCSQGGMVIGPLLKEMSHLIHTEYLLSGETNLDIIDILRESMFAATVTGSPIENACNIICKYENEPRRYYASAIALIGREERNEFLDSCITIRTFEISHNGDILLRVGGTLVRDSDIQEEIQETKFKISAMINILINKKTIKNPISLLDFFKNDDEIAEALQQRNQNLSNFWFFNQSKNIFLSEKSVLIIHNGDDFCFMIKHMLTIVGCKVKVVSYKNYKKENSDIVDLTVIGPGPGDPQNQKDIKMKKNSEIINELLKSNKVFIAICLGHQLLCQNLGIPLRKKKVPHQGIQKEITFFGTHTKVGFYNTFEAIHTIPVSDIKISYNKESKEIYGLKNKYFHSYQFHPESILTKEGYGILQNSVLSLLEKH